MILFLIEDYIIITSNIPKPGLGQGGLPLRDLPIALLLPHYQTKVLRIIVQIQIQLHVLNTKKRLFGFDLFESPLLRVARLDQSLLFLTVAHKLLSECASDMKDGYVESSEADSQLPFLDVFEDPMLIHAVVFFIQDDIVLTESGSIGEIESMTSIFAQYLPSAFQGHDLFRHFLDKCKFLRKISF